MAVTLILLGRNRRIEVDGARVHCGSNRSNLPRILAILAVRLRVGNGWADAAHVSGDLNEASWAKALHRYDHSYMWWSKCVQVWKRNGQMLCRLRKGTVEVEPQDAEALCTIAALEPLGHYLRDPIADTDVVAMFTEGFSEPYALGAVRTFAECVTFELRGQIDDAISAAERFLRENALHRADILFRDVVGYFSIQLQTSECHFADASAAAEALLRAQGSASAYDPLVAQRLQAFDLILRELVALQGDAGGAADVPALTEPAHAARDALTVIYALECAVRRVLSIAQTVHRMPGSSHKPATAKGSANLRALLEDAHTQAVTMAYLALRELRPHELIRACGLVAAVWKDRLDYRLGFNELRSRDDERYKLALGWLGMAIRIKHASRPNFLGLYESRLMYQLRWCLWDKQRRYVQATDLMDVILGFYNAAKSNKAAQGTPAFQKTITNWRRLLQNSQLAAMTAELKAEAARRKQASLWTEASSLNTVNTFLPPTRQ